ncbi:hypothetical protein N8I71_00610 [Roseibacterium sp. SDUM158016]|uniref:hypothetical protein n=1 Tax=Roseicyclus sediminis TaxID=2980997 RepID=UPI0021CFA8D0|nr:hypothetical protein [Roseibacterium sp. SDUM158016]MCU4651316.1 hypothetical protein [Roseibacterium sp. SDUM158016]
MLCRAVPILLLSACLTAAPLHAQSTEGPPRADPMTPVHMAEIFAEIDPEVVAGPGGMQFTLDDVPVTVIYDLLANRMRALVPVASSEGLTEAQMLRLLQANFDTALDARYAVAQGRVWAVFIHPFAELDRRQLISGVAQAVALAQSYGTTFSSTGMLFGRGDSGQRLQELLEPDIDL